MLEKTKVSRWKKHLGVMKAYVGKSAHTDGRRPMWRHDLNENMSYTCKLISLPVTQLADHINTCSPETIQDIMKIPQPQRLAHFFLETKRQKRLPQEKLSWSQLTCRRVLTDRLRLPNQHCQRRHMTLSTVISIIPSGWLGSKHQLTNYTTTITFLLLNSRLTEGIWLIITYTSEREKCSKLSNLTSMGGEFFL